MEIKNNLQYTIAEQLETDITKLLYTLDSVGTIFAETYNGLESYRNVLHAKRKEYDCNRFPAKTIKTERKNDTNINS